MNIQEELFKISDKEYAKFQAKLAPTISKSAFIGVRVPRLRKLAKIITNNPIFDVFINDLPHKYYDENLLQSILLNTVNDYVKCIEYIERFLPYIDNWAVCDTLRPPIFKKNTDKLIINIRKWTESDSPYTIRFGINMLMSFYLDDKFKPEYLEIPASIVSNDYYVNMMIAWYYATALAKQWDSTIPYIENNRLSKWNHNKTIQKANESFRITSEQKVYLNSLKRKNNYDYKHE